MRISDWSSDVCSSDLGARRDGGDRDPGGRQIGRDTRREPVERRLRGAIKRKGTHEGIGGSGDRSRAGCQKDQRTVPLHRLGSRAREDEGRRSEEHTSELQSLMRISYAVFCLKKKK